MKFNPDIHHRHSIRLKNYDYSQAGLYFITICTENRYCLFGDIQNSMLILNDAGNMIANQWIELAQRFQTIVLHDFIVMPNHFHGIIELVKTLPCDCPNNTSNVTLGNIVGAFKSLSTHHYIQNVKQNNWQAFTIRLWQRNYHEHIIRNEASYLKIAEYVQTNPLRWQEDKYYI